MPSLMDAVWWVIVLLAGGAVGWWVSAKRSRK
jgi:hypothetical protein